MKIATAEQMREIDQIAIQQYGISEIVLMENAGVVTAAAVSSLFSAVNGQKISVFAGTGNNGGDAFVAARHLSNQGFRMKIYIVGNMDKITAAAKLNLTILQNMNLDIMQILSERDWDKVKIALAFSDAFIDGLLGTGFKGELRAAAERIINMINGAQKPTVAIDLPSGVDADTGQATVAVQAVKTVSFGLPKLGLLLYPGATFAGEIKICDIGLPNVLLTDEHIKQNMMNTSMVSKLLMPRLPDVHKGSCGKILLIAGSNGLTGAAVLAAQAAMRAGAGAVTLAIAASLQDIVAAKLTEVMTYPLPEIAKGVIGQSALPVLLELAANYDVVAIGSGLGRHSETWQLVRDFVQLIDKQVVIDADGINAYQGRLELLHCETSLPILTPHLGEMANLLNRPVAEVKADIVGTAQEAAQRLPAIVVLKSARTIVAYPDGTVYINVKGNAGMATAGSGDVLAGVISGLCAQGLLRQQAAVAGVYLHACAGDIAAQMGKIGIIAGDIVTALPRARQKIEQ